MPECAKYALGDAVRLPDDTIGTIWAYGPRDHELGAPAGGTRFPHPPPVRRNDDRLWVAVGTIAVLVDERDLRPVHHQPQIGDD